MFGQGMVLPEETLKDVFNRAVAEAKPLGDLRIYANSEDVASLGDLWERQQSSLLGIKIELVSQDSIQRGGCIIEGDFGSLDARVDIKLSHILEKIAEIEKMPFETKETNEDFSRKEDIGWNSHLIENMREAETMKNMASNSALEEGDVLDMDYSFDGTSADENEMNLLNPGQFNLDGEEGQQE
jgi:antitoxin component of RelBE/YafQ-DinJ toxin-antitoxin module